MDVVVDGPSPGEGGSEVDPVRQTVDTYSTQHMHTLHLVTCCAVCTLKAEVAAAVNHMSLDMMPRSS